MLNMLSIILYKEMHISALQVTFIVALKPLSALFAPYWSLSIYQRQDRLTSNLVWANILRYLPFLFFPWIASPWLMILAFSFYMMLSRGAMPAWMEIFKQNIPGMARERVFVYGTAVDYFGSAILPIMIGFLLDGYPLSWRWIFPITALIGLVSTLFLWRIPSPILQTTAPVKEKFLKQLWKPLEQSWTLMQQRPDFARFQIGFMLGGAGLMIMQPALPMFFVDVLNLSYTKMVLAIAACKGIGFALASPIWIKFFRRLNIYRFSGLVTVVAALFPFLLISAQYDILLLYLAYGIYGMMQAGSELSWHMSGPIFAKEEDSSLYSRTNVLTVGLRGCLVPFLGSLIYAVSNSTVVMVFAALLCLLATQRLTTYGRREDLVPI